MKVISCVFIACSVLHAVDTNSLFIEAETYNRIDNSGWAIERAYKNASSGKYIVSAGIYESRGRIEYTIDMPVADTYYLFLRTWATNPGDNGVFVTLDNKNPDNPDYTDGLYFYKKDSGQWATKVSCGDGCHKNTPYFIVEKLGKHLLSLRVKEVGAKIDMIALKTSDSVPGDSLAPLTTAPKQHKIPWSKAIPVAATVIAFIAILLRWKRKKQVPVVPKQFSAVSNKAMACIRDHYAEEISLSELARFAGLSEDYVGKIFKYDTGTNFLQHTEIYLGHHRKASRRIIISKYQTLTVLFNRFSQ